MIVKIEAAVGQLNVLTKKQSVNIEMKSHLQLDDMKIFMSAGSFVLFSKLSVAQPLWGLFNVCFKCEVKNDLYWP